MTQGSWRGWTRPALQPAADPARPSLRRPPSPLRARGCGSALRIRRTGAVGTRPHLPPASAQSAPPPASAAPAGHSGKLRGRRRREGRKGGERRRRGPGGQQPSPPGRPGGIPPAD
ncbi:RNA-binding motif protein, X chromosome-like [Rhinolophus ferrumequinum]|uniref:RNA-binding motif protein, X chromosome-like n=1 Tax=Rhinolophus ferrumequinum TaxID=59479 RepID=UPI00140FD523|nr:RNA-binding motif protein, X chromosome-like [Rhinolophus ferrumequinum]